eukprot:comp22736_c1_seq1/m.35417 comp22736_c1_seq1/g.35417  ORF comp22736_c1_seq1/g.35417 comp22736_c1_seq1/m.35417 type:complete len:312 (-) comp22736_c1_seq1:282-1217(-)
MEHLRIMKKPGGRKAAPKNRVCSNCSTSKSSCWAYSKLQPEGWRCHTCRVYEYNHGRLRPPHLYMRTKRAERVCGNCAVVGPYNRHRSKLATDPNVWICHACYVFESAHNKSRPSHLFTFNRKPEDGGSPRLDDATYTGMPTPSPDRRSSFPNTMQHFESLPRTAEMTSPPGCKGHGPVCHCMQCLLHSQPSPASSVASLSPRHTTTTPSPTLAPTEAPTPTQHYAPSYAGSFYEQPAYSYEHYNDTNTWPMQRRSVDSTASSTIVVGSEMATPTRTYAYEAQYAPYVPVVSHAENPISSHPFSMEAMMQA